MGNESSFLKDQQGQEEPNEEESNDRFHHVLDNASLFVCTGSSVGSATAGATGAGGATARTTNSNNNNSNSMATLLAQADALCISSPPNSPTNDNFDSFHSNDNNTINITADNSKATSTLIHPSSALFARALVSQVNNTTSTTSTSAIVSREVKLLKANRAVKSNSKSNRSTTTTTTTTAATTRSKPIGSVSSTTTPLLTSIYHSAKAAVLDYDDDHGGSAGGAGVDATTTSASTTNHKNNNSTTAKTHIPTNAIQENGTNPFQNVVHSSNNTTTNNIGTTSGKYTVTIGLSLSRRHSTVGHLDTITRQGAFDFNELQDRDYKYVSSTDSSGWRAGGGERGGGSSNTDTTTTTTPHKVAAPDTVHIPIIHIHAESPMAVDAIISALARGELFIPHMAVLPEALSVNGTVPPDIMVRFNCERTTNDDDDNGVVVPEEWPNWCLEFMHNQLYEYFYSYGAVWTKRPFCITLARKVRWKTVKHMNRYFAHAERVLDAWREMGPQYLTPQLAYNNRQGTTPEEVARPHGIYLFRNGVPTNYFAPNFEPPYTTKMTRSLLMNVLDKSWDKRKREWTNEPVPRLVTPSTLLATMCGCTDPTQEGFMASQVTTPSYNYLDEDHHGPQMTVVVDAMVHTPQEEEEDVMLPNVFKSTIVEDSFEGMSPQSNQSLVSSHLLNPMDATTTTATATTTSNAASSGTTVTSDIEEKKISALTTLRHGPAPKPEQLHNMIMTPTKPLDTSMEEIDGSQTTVLHMNSSSMRLVEKEFERQQQRKNNNPLRLETPTEGTPSEEAETPFSKMSTTPAAAAVGSIVEHNPCHTKNDPRPVTLATKASAKNEGRDKYSMYISEDNGSITTTTNRSVQRSDSSVSLDYSMDSSLFGGGGTSIMSGGALLPSMDSGSVVTSMSNPSRRKNGTRRGGNDTSATNNTLATNVPSIESIPTDMELLAIGWAKAFDQNSGSYYYFTLDRSKIVWDNPLEPASTASDSLQEGST